MFQKITKLTSSEAVVDINAAIYVFHEPPIEGQKLMRATTAAYLLASGELFVGCSCASEGDQFERAKGRTLALEESEAKLLRWLRKGKQTPDAILKVDPDAEGTNSYQATNRMVMYECLAFVHERFRLILAKRSDIIKRLSDEMDQTLIDIDTLASSVLRQYTPK